LLQSPLRPRWRPYNIESSSVRVRPKQHQLELKQEFDQSSATYDAESSNPLSRQTLSSSLTPNKLSYFSGMLSVTGDLAAAMAGQEGGTSAGTSTGTDAAPPAVLHLSRLDACVQLRPSFSEVDEGTEETAHAAAPASASAPSAADKGGASSAEVAQAIAPIFRLAESEKELEARRASHAYLVEQREAEPWSDVRLHGEHDKESIGMRQSIFGLPGGDAEPSVSEGGAEPSDGMQSDGNAAEDASAVEE